MYLRLVTFLRCLKSWFFVPLRSTRTWFARTWFCRGISSSLRSTKQISMEPDDDCDCELDSTWEDEYDDKTPRKKPKRSRRSWYAAKDMQDFRHSCLELDDDDGQDYTTIEAEKDFHNLKFYRGQIVSSPDEIHIDDFHKKWRGQYGWLEDVHSYIQWMFPIQEHGMNWRAHVLTKKEIKYFRGDKKAQSKLVKSYEVMLDFYGIRLANKNTGEVERANNWRQRFINLNRYTHNNLRITRIIKCLGTLGLEHYQAPLVKFFLHETLVKGELNRVKESVLDYFMFAVLDKSKRKELVRYAYEHFRPREDFVWAPKKILQKETSKEGEQQRVRTRDRTHEMNKRHAGPPPEGMGTDKPCKNYQQKDNEAVSQNKLMGENIQSDQGANNKNSQSISNNKMVENHNQGTSVDCDNDVENSPHGDELGCDESNHVESEEFNEKNRPVSPEKMNEESGSNDKNSLYSLGNEVVKEQNQKSSDGNNEVHMIPQNKPNGNYVEIGKTNENAMLDNNDVEMEEDGMPHGDNGNNTENDRPGSPYKLTEQNNNQDKRSNNETNCEDESNLNNTENTNEEMSEGHDQGSNDENSQCSLENKTVQNQNEEMSVDGDSHSEMFPMKGVHV